MRLGFQALYLEVIPEGWMDLPDTVRKKGKLTVVPMRGWKRNMLWTETGLRWIPTSPYIPDLSAVLGYAMTGLGAQEGDFTHGIGTPYPFRLLQYKGKSPIEVKAALRAKKIPGLSYQIIHTHTPAGTKISGVYVSVSNWTKVRPTELSFYMMQLAAEWSPNNPFTYSENSDLFNKHVGSTSWWNEITRYGAQARISTFVDGWSTQARDFQKHFKRFLIY